MVINYYLAMEILLHMVSGRVWTILRAKEARRWTS